MPKRGFHRASGRQDAESERPARWHGQPLWRRVPPANPLHFKEIIDHASEYRICPAPGLKSKEEFTNLELWLEWRHLQEGGNSGVFLWAPPKVFVNLPKGRLPAGGIEVQILDHGYTAQYEKGGRKADWFTTNGDVFPVGSSKMKPFPPLSPNGSRSFPRAEHSKGTPEWNHYYVRAINGEVRLWVNGHEVSGGRDCQPATGHLCLEAEGAPVEFRNLRIRELP